MQPISAGENLQSPRQMIAIVDDEWMAIIQKIHCGFVL